MTYCVAIFVAILILSAGMVGWMDSQAAIGAISTLFVGSIADWVHPRINKPFV